MTAIEWTHRPGTVPRTWNPTKGCSRVSEGCRHCYAERMAGRIVRMGKGKPTPYDGLVKMVDGEARWTGVVRLVPETLALPLSWRQPSTVFVDSMSDLFYESLTDEQIAAVFGVMAATRHHTYIILTKRAERLPKWFQWANSQPVEPGSGHGAVHPIGVCAAAASAAGMPVTASSLYAQRGGGPAPWPLPNVWIGVSVENQDAADQRIPPLLATPAEVRLLSCEPLLGPVDLRRVRPHPVPIDALTGRWSVPQRDGSTQEPRVHMVIAGCESGPGARSCEVAWLRSLRDQCAAAGVSFFLKQATRVVDGILAPAAAPPEIIQCVSPFGVRYTDSVIDGPGSKRKASGVIGLPYLDGVQHKEIP